MLKVFPATLTHDNRKVPVANFNWREDCTNDINIINSWSTLYPQMKFYGVPTGKVNGIFALDVDVKGGGLETIKKYHVPLTLSQTTMSGGKHHIFKYPEDGEHYGNKVGFDHGLDVRGENGYIISYNLDATPLCEAPDWFREVALGVKKATVDLTKVVQICPTICRIALDEACENITNAPEGESNDILNTESYKIGQMIHSMDHESTYNELFNAAKERGKPDYEAKATIQSGLKGGALAPFISPFGNNAPVMTIPEAEEFIPTRWTPAFFTKYELTNTSKLRKPQIFANWSTEDIAITTADGGTGKTTLKLVEAIHLALGEDFLGFKCKAPGRTLFITGEDSREKIGAMIGAILKQMNLLDDKEKVAKVMSSILVKKEGDMCLVTKSKENFYAVNMEAFNKINEAVEDFRPKLIVFDPIAMFWGPESGLNDMTKAVTKFMGMLVERSEACVEAINHMGKSSSTSKDMSQFAGRGGTGLPSHARVSRVLRPVFDEEYQDLTGFELAEGTSAIMCNVNKFSDGSPLYNKPFIIVRDGYLFSKVTLIERKAKEEQSKMTDTERVFTFIKNERDSNRYPSKLVVTGYFAHASDKVSKERINAALGMLAYTGHMGEKISSIDNPDIAVGGKSYVITDLEGKEL